MRKLLCGVLAAFLLVAVACGGSTSSSSDSSSAGSTPAASSDPNARLRFAHYLGANSWDPHLSLGGPDLNLLALVYDTLVHATPNGEAAPGMAQSWESADGGLSLVMKLRSGITFTDGTPFDASAVKANIERAMTVEKTTLKSQLASVAAVEVVDPTTVRFRLKAPNSGLPLVLADRPGMMISPKVLAGDVNKTPIGSGMFTLKTNQPGQSATFDRNAGYWEPDVVKVAGLDMSVMNDSKTRLNALVSGSIDVAQLDVSQLAEIKSRGLETVTGIDLRFFALELNPTVTPALGDARVRLALSLAIDRAAIVKGLLFGEGSALDQAFPPGVASFNDQIVGAWKHDPTRAKDLLAQAGVNGLSFTVAIGTDPLQGQVTEAMQAQLKEVGVNIEIRKFDGFGSGNAFWTEKSVAAGMFRVTGTLAPTGTIEKFFVAGAQNNPGNVTSPTVDGLLKQALAEPDPAKQAKILQEASAAMVKEPLGTLPLVQEQIVLGATKKVSGLQSWLAGYPNFTGVGITK